MAEKRVLAPSDFMIRNEGGLTSGRDYFEISGLDPDLCQVEVDERGCLLISSEGMSGDHFFQPYEWCRPSPANMQAAT